MNLIRLLIRGHLFLPCYFHRLTATGKVTIPDADPDQLRPYRISFDTFWKGLSIDYHQVFKPFGYGRGGHVYIQR